MRKIKSVPALFQPVKKDLARKKTFKMADVQSKKLLCLQQQINVLKITSLQLGTQMLIMCINRQHMINKTISILIAKQNHMRKSLFSRHRKTRKKRQLWFKQCRTDKWWVDMMLAVSPIEDLWKKNFRLSRIEFDEICNELRPYISPNLTSPNYRALSVEKKVASVLYFLKDTGSLTMTANTFGIHQSTLSKVVEEVCYAFVTFMVPKLIKLPKSQDEMLVKISEFEAKFGMTQAFGCIDGTHIPLKAPIVNSQDYYNYKQFFSINVQGVCDFKGYFMDVDCRWPGSCHDAKVYSNSSIKNKMNENELPMVYKQIIPGEDKVANYLIGDPAYPLTPFCMKEHDSCNSNAQTVFNSILREARNPIECAYGRLKARWGILKKNIDFKLETVPYIILTCFGLHNFCERNKTGIDEVVFQNQQVFQKSTQLLQENLPDPIYSGNNIEGTYVRNLLTDYISQNLPDSY